MHCDGCADRLQKVLSGKAGVQSARISFPDKQAFLEYDSSAISSYQIKDAVEKAGFEIVTAQNYCENQRFHDRICDG